MAKKTLPNCHTITDCKDRHRVLTLWITHLDSGAAAGAAAGAVAADITALTMVCGIEGCRRNGGNGRGGTSAEGVDGRWGRSGATFFPRGKIEVSDSQGESLRKNFVPGLRHVDFSQVCRHVDKFQICRSVDLSIFPAKLINRQIDRLTDQQSTNLIWDTKITKKHDFCANQICRQIFKKINRSTDKFGFLGHSNRDVLTYNTGAKLLEIERVPPTKVHTRPAYKTDLHERLLTIFIVTTDVCMFWMRCRMSEGVGHEKPILNWNRSLC